MQRMIEWLQEPTHWWVVVLAINAGAGAVIGRVKGSPFSGLVLGVLLGLIGWLVVAVVGLFGPSVVALLGLGDSRVAALLIPIAWTVVALLAAIFWAAVAVGVSCLLPFTHNVRSLRVRRGTTIMTALATGLVVWASVLTFGLADGLKHALSISASELDLIVLRKGSTNEISSGVEDRLAREVATLAGIAIDDDGRPMCSAEFVTILTKPRRGDGGTTNVIVRGLKDVGRELRPGFKIVEGKGRDFVPGQNEAITSRRMAERFENLGLGEKFVINNVPFEIVGYFEAKGSAAESEVWTDVKDLTTVRRTPGAVSSVQLRAQDLAAKDSLIHRIQDDEQFNLKVVDGKQYFEDQMTSAITIRVVGYFIAGFLTVGAMFAAANTMYAAVASRAREIGTLRALGFARSSILVSFLLESVVLCLLGGAIGCLGTLPFNGLSTGTANFSTFSEITFSFNFGPAVLLQGVLMAVTMGVLGGLAPAVRAVRLNIIQALREL